MTENRTDRTTNLGLLALMQSPSGGGPSSGTQGWGWPYWNQLWLDALIAALHEAARTGEALITAPATGPTVELSSTTGYLPAGLTLEVCQTWVDEWGRETAAGTVSQVSTGEAIPDPDTAPALGTPTPAASGFDGGLLEVAYSWIDEATGETLSSPVASVSVPYRTGGLQSEVLVTLPATPTSVGAAGAFIYARHRSGNWVRAAAISDPAEDEVTLDGTWISCFVALPLANSTGAGKAVDITGIAAPADAALTRFYVRIQGESWTSGDRRLALGGADEWDPASVSYPLTYAGGVGELAPGYPPPVSLVRAIRKIDLATEVDGTLDESLIDAAICRDSELSGHTGESTLHFTGTEKADCLLSSAQKSGLTGGAATTLHTHSGLTQLALARIQWRQMQACMDIADAARDPLLLQRMWLADFTDLDAGCAANGVVSGLVVSDGGVLDVDVTSGAAICDGAYHSVGSDTLTLADDATNYVFVDEAGALDSDTEEPDAAILAVVTTASGDITDIATTGRVDQSAYDDSGHQLLGVASGVTYFHTVPVSALDGTPRVLATWRRDYSGGAADIAWALHARIDGGEWFEIEERSAYEPDCLAADVEDVDADAAVEFRVTLTSTHVANYPIVTHVAAVWEDHDA